MSFCFLNPIGAKPKKRGFRFGFRRNPPFFNTKKPMSSVDRSAQVADLLDEALETAKGSARPTVSWQSGRWVT